MRLRKLQDRLQSIQRQVVQGVRRPTVAALHQRVATAITKAGPPVRDWVRTTIGEPDAVGRPTLTYTIDHEQLMHWGQTLALPAVLQAVYNTLADRSTPCVARGSQLSCGHN